jgi:hypothetical protein
MVKAYIISNKNIVKNYSDILESNIFYNIKPTMKIYKTLENLVDNHTKVKAKKTTTEKIELNKKITKLNKELEDLLNE